jgi:hypothetical protein
MTVFVLALISGGIRELSGVVHSLIPVLIADQIMIFIADRMKDFRGNLANP